MSVEEAPFIIADHEHLVRECGSGDIKGGGKVKPRAFVATREPLEISVHRDGYCDEVCRDRARAAAMVVAGTARLLESRPLVTSKVPPIDHALISVRDAPPINSMAELTIEAHAAIAAQHTALCRELASIAVACERQSRIAPLS